MPVAARIRRDDRPAASSNLKDIMMTWMLLIVQAPAGRRVAGAAPVPGPARGNSEPAGSHLWRRPAAAASARHAGSVFAWRLRDQPQPSVTCLWSARPPSRLFSESAILSCRPAGVKINGQKERSRGSCAGWRSRRSRRGYGGHGGHGGTTRALQSRVALMRMRITWMMAATPGSLCASGFCAKMTTKMAMAAATAQKANTKPIKSQLFKNSLPKLDALESSPRSGSSTVLTMNRDTRAIKPGNATIPILPDGGSQPPSTPTDPGGIEDFPPSKFIEVADEFEFEVDEFEAPWLILTTGTAVPQPHGSRLKSA
mmetsp:Transcript_27293/g.56759  ORF Transcript_27293/g.56759 Transcript_27293/m.56759 type:complete len:313 (-) Transcript_27293:136-1074(-)